jgi:hypothetical protein
MYRGHKPRYLGTGRKKSGGNVLRDLEAAFGDVVQITPGETTGNSGQAREGITKRPERGCLPVRAKARPERPRNSR